MFEMLEARQLLAAHIVGNSTVYSSIQAAVDAAAPNSVITVDPGTYTEQVTVYKTLTLRGAQAGVDARSNGRLSDGGAGETIVTGTSGSAGVSNSFRITANDVTLDGFIVQGETSKSDTQGAGIVIDPQIAGTHILNNLIQNNVSGLFLANYSSSDPALIQHNVFRNNNNPGANGGRGIYTNGEISGGNLTNVVIDSNAFLGNRGSSGTTGLEAAMAFEAGTAGKQFNITITNNVLDGNGKAVLFFHTAGITISGNYVTNTLDQYSGTLRFEGDNQNVSITNNTLYDNTGPAVAIDCKGVPGDNSGFVINSNNIYGNSLAYGSHIGVAIDGSVYDGVPDVRFNYWGSASGPGGDGPGTGDGVYGIGHVVPGGQWSVSKGGNELFSPFATAPVGSLTAPYMGLASGDGAIIEAENFDHGGEGAAYHDSTSGNAGGKYRPRESVDLQSTSDSGGGYNVYSTTAGEWLGYTVSLAQGGTYDLDFRVANGQSTGGTFHVEIDGADVTGPMTVISTGSYSTWQTMTKTGVSLTAGAHQLRLVFDSNGSGGQVGNFNWFKLTNTSAVQVPAAPTGLIATAPNQTTVNLVWNDNANNETGYVVERKTGANGTWAVIASLPQDSTSYPDTTVAAASSYVYRVHATGAGGDSANSNEASVQTPGLPAVTYLSDLAWTSSTNGWGPVERDMSVGGQGAGDGSTLTLNGVTYAKGLGTNSISDIVYNLAGQYGNFQADIGVDDHQTSNGTVNFQVFADGVMVYDSGVMTPTSATQSISLDMTGVQQLRLHVGDAGDGNAYDWGDWANARLLLTAPAPTLPAAPSALSAAAVSASQIKLTWIDNASNETGFVIERSPDGTTGWTSIASIGSNVTSYSDTGLSATTQYFYRIYAVNALGSSDPSNVASATTQAVSSTTYLSDLVWTSSTNGWGPVERDMSVGGQGAGDGGVLTLNGVTYAKGLGTNSISDIVYNLAGQYGTFQSDIGVDDHQTVNGTVDFQVFADGKLIFDSGIMTPASATQSISVDVTGVQQLQLHVGDGGDGNAYDWGDWAGARLLAGNGPVTPTAPLAPDQLTAAGSSTSQIDLTWHDNSSDESGFVIQRSPDGSTGWTTVNTTAANATGYSDTALTAGTQYFYRVYAINSVGTSAGSNIASATTLTAPAPTLPDGWANTDIGTVGLAGSATFNAGVYTLSGAGAGIGGRTDSLNFTSESASGDCSVIVRVLQPASGSAGIMIRDALSAGGREVSLMLNANGSVTFASRSSTGGRTNSTNASRITGPQWLKLVRSGSTVRGYRSTDGARWTLIGSGSLSSGNVYVGLAVTSKTTLSISTATIDNVTAVV
jgi:hypothetical protein